jgi:hypothetical protein
VIDNAARLTHVQELLLKAAEFAALQPSAKKAVDAAWSALHLSDSLTMRSAFEAWAKNEGLQKYAGGYDIPSLGGILRRRYKFVSDIVSSLTTAAASPGTHALD